MSNVDVLVHVVVDGLWIVPNTHAGTAGPLRVSPPEAVGYLNEIQESYTRGGARPFPARIPVPKPNKPASVCSHTPVSRS